MGEAEAVGIYNKIEGQRDTCFLTEKVLARNFLLINGMSMELSLKTAGYLLSSSWEIARLIITLHILNGFYTQK